MKKLTFLAVALIVIATSCKKEKSPTPTGPAVTTPTAGMTATETALVGKWYWDKTESYSGGTATTLSDPAYESSLIIGGGTMPWVGPAYMDFKTSVYVDYNSAFSPYNKIYDVLYYAGNPSLNPIGATSWEVLPIGIDQTHSNVGAIYYPAERVNIFGMDGSTVEFPWTDCYINILNSTTLVLTTWNSTPSGTGGLANGIKWSYHK
jgi:hypothetical protein